MSSEKNLDAPTPPGGPQRTDAPEGSEGSQGEADDEGRDLQEENAATSLDQPSS